MNFRFVIKERETFFSNAQRSRIVYAILARAFYEDADPQNPAKRRFGRCLFYYKKGILASEIYLVIACLFHDAGSNYQWYFVLGLSVCLLYVCMSVSKLPSTQSSVNIAYACSLRSVRWHLMLTTLSPCLWPCDSIWPRWGIVFHKYILFTWNLFWYLYCQLIIWLLTSSVIFSILFFIHTWTQKSVWPLLCMTSSVTLTSMMTFSKVR